MPERLTSHQIQIDESKLQYNPRFDVESFRSLHSLRAQAPEEYHHELANLLELTKTNLMSSIAERLNVEIYKTSYRQENGQLYHNDFYPHSPFIEIIRHGQKTREMSGSAETARERAEIASFQKVQEELNTATNEETGEAKKVIVISPKGKGNSIYGHNFFDVYQINADGKITMSRYTSQATYDEFGNAALKLDPFTTIPKNPTDADFISNPLVTYQTIEQITTTLNRDKKTMSSQQFQEVVQIIMPQAQIILDKLQQNSTADQIDFLYRSLKKSAEIAAGYDHQFEGSYKEQILDMMQSSPLEIAYFLSQQPLREVKTGCGISAGGALSPYSVAEFSLGSSFSSAPEDQYGTREIHCEECGQTYLRDSGKLEEKCRNCGGTKGIVC